MAKLTDINKLLEALISDLKTQSVMNKLGNLAKSRIVKRTRKGLDVDEKLFKPYSESYAKIREESERPTHIVNLEFDLTNEGLLHKVDHVVFRNFDGVSIDILDPEKRKIAAYHDSEGVGIRGKNIRHFWGLNKKDEEVIHKSLGVETDKILSDLTRDLD